MYAEIYTAVALRKHIEIAKFSATVYNNDVYSFIDRAQNYFYSIGLEYEVDYDDIVVR